MEDAELEAFVWSEPLLRTKAVWHEVVEYLARRFAVQFGLRVQCGNLYLDADHNRYAKLSIRSAAPTSGPVEVVWEGDVHGAYDSLAGGWAVAVIFPFVCGVRVAPCEDRDGYLCYRYERSTDGNGAWQLRGWQSDEYSAWREVARSGDYFQPSAADSGA